MWQRPAAWALATLLFVAGMWTVPLALFGPDRDLIPGDPDEARLDNYMLEHFHLYSIGKADAYWDAPFMQPRKNTAALSDNLLGTAPLYSVFRCLGNTREAAFQGWMLVLFALNYWCCLLALRKWAGSTVLAACAAFIFAFGIYHMGQLHNAQALPKFMMPVALFFLWNHLRTGAWRWLLLAMLATVYQFYCGIYPGSMLVYGLCFLFLGHLIAYRKPSFLQRFRNWRFSAVWASSLVVAFLLLLPITSHYMAVQPALGQRDLSAIFPSLPRPSSYFFAHPGALSWRALSGPVEAFTQGHDHFHFMGALPWLTLLAVPFVLLSKRTATEHKRLLIVLAAALVLSVLFSLNIGGSSLYALIYALPGFSLLGDIDRYINVQAIIFLALFVAVLRPLFRKPRLALLCSVLLPLLVVQDNRWDVGAIKRFDKFRSQDMVRETARRIMREHKPDGTMAIAYTPYLAPASTQEERRDQLITMHLNAMLAAQDLGLAVVNGHAHHHPEAFIPSFEHPDRYSLAAWCVSHGVAVDRVQRIDGLGLEVIEGDAVHIQSAYGGYVHTDADQHGRVRTGPRMVADQGPFLRLHTKDGRLALLAPNGRFVCAELEEDDRLAATGSDLGDFGLFTAVELDHGEVAFKAYNGRYVIVEPGTGLLYASGDGLHSGTGFRILPILVDNSGQSANGSHSSSSSPK